MVKITQRLLFVVHRYVPHPGGSENNTQVMAEEAVNRGYRVTVLADKHGGDYNGVRVTSDRDIIYQRFDLMIIHGGYREPQRYVLSHINKIPNPVLYLIVEPYKDKISLYGLKNSDYIGWATKQDRELIRSLHLQSKSHKIRYSINIDRTKGKNGFKKKYKVRTKMMFLSVGGFWPWKGMNELKDAFIKSQSDNTTLVLMGYDQYNFAPQSEKTVMVIKGASRQDVLSAIKEADLYIMNSSREGFGVVLLEAMNNKTPWIARNIAGANLLRAYGTVYSTFDDLVSLIKKYSPDRPQIRTKIEKGYQYIIDNLSSSKVINDIEEVLYVNQHKSTKFSFVRRYFYLFKRLQCLLGK